MREPIKVFQVVQRRIPRTTHIEVVRMPKSPYKRVQRKSVHRVIID